MAEEPLVSVVLPTYNRARVLPKSIDSILAQTFTDFELIIVDDGSTDNTKRLVTDYSARDSRVRYVKHEANRGLAAGRNTGAREAHGRYIANNDSDDVWISDKLEKDVAAIQSASPNVGVVYSRLKKTLGNGTEVYVPADNWQWLNGNLHRSILEGNFITMQVTLIKKECFQNAGWFDEEFPAVQEGDFLLRVAKKYEFLYRPEVGVIAAVSPDSITANQGKRLTGKEMLFNKHLIDFKKYPHALARFSYSLGHAFSLRGDMKRGRKYLFLAWRNHLSHPKYLLAFFLSLFGSHTLYKKTGTIYLKLK
ncbi:MAG: hypothetical protein COU90_01965 [Candidatus Ryanbacteria bacterium CG10_big_fil_rev_8_21_14_0_10_43_42]|uniref:Glycosyltransferase 2-like domain-containing protein n=1 Tax=Candidatus Ryanbacteria bacterium CG10_big_fil_rev_8_21_14_0_10_43_42 TaxID=1974864 RepID=A0A2M8KXH0_9BACT|nr:MAG: hypothetical protein COU90_01965 [Candidatus Ryanbacteria bacterium CG10_big_fil_rev_8_21_14_0_10_43_42]